MMNKAAGWCDITAMGSYDYKQGGHLILFNINKIIEFPPGSHILIPLAVMWHANTPIKLHEKCMGFTQYATGALFQWVNQGFGKLSEVKASAEAPTCFENLLNLYLKLEELEDDCSRVSAN
jgi:hypothetical protein